MKKKDRTLRSLVLNLKYKTYYIIWPGNFEEEIFLEKAVATGHDAILRKQYYRGE